MPQRSVVTNSVLICALAYNLVFLVQELGLVVAKAMTPGLHPVLYHNNHSWTGDHPLVPLLQGSGALATIAMGFLCVLWLARWPPRSLGWWLFALWMAVMGFAEALPQVIIGTIIPGNDVGMAMEFLGLTLPMKIAACSVALIALLLVGRWAAPRLMGLAAHSRPMTSILIVAVVPLLLMIVVAIPLRVPGAPIEVLLPPTVDALAAAIAIVTGALRATPAKEAMPERPTSGWLPLASLVLLLALFQLVLRRGIAF